jgi:hypothetical protein
VEVVVIAMVMVLMVVDTIVVAGEMVELVVLGSGRNRYCGTDGDGAIVVDESNKVLSIWYNIESNNNIDMVAKALIIMKTEMLNSN